MGPNAKRDTSCEPDMNGKIAVVTGGSRGIGRGICLRLAALGARVMVNYSNSEAAAVQVQQEIRDSGGVAQICRFDVADARAATEALKTIIQNEGGVHILVNNAGITRDSLLPRMKEADWDEVAGVNLKGAFVCTQAVIMTMLRQKWGRVINIGSVVGTMGNPGQANYAASKAGLEGFTKSIAREVASRGVTANVVAPGFIQTDMTAALPEKIREQLLGQIPAGRMGQPEDVADAVAFLASERASYITGHVLHVNGGLICA